MERMPNRKICLAFGEGTTFPMARTASGKILLGRLPEEIMNRVLMDDETYANASQAEQKRIRRRIAEARKNGFITESSDLTEGVADIAIPVGVDGTGTASVLAISYLASAKTADGIQRKYLMAAMRYAEEINRNLGIS
jgi:DNA-binding IclR family transcriptional regulator